MKFKSNETKFKPHGNSFGAVRRLRRGMGVPPMNRPKGVPPLPEKTCHAQKNAEQGQDAPATEHGRDAHATGDHALSATASRAAATVRSITPSSCAVETNHASYPLGGR